MSINFKPHVQKIEKIVTIKEQQKEQNNNWDDYKKTLSQAKNNPKLSKLSQSLLTRISLLETLQKSHIEKKDKIKDNTLKKASKIKSKNPYNTSNIDTGSKKLDSKSTDRIDIATFDWSSLEFGKNPKFIEGIKSFQEGLNAIKGTRLYHNITYIINNVVNTKKFSLEDFKSGLVEVMLILKNFSKDKKNHADIKKFFNVKDQTKSDKLLKELIGKRPQTIIDDFDKELSKIYAQVGNNKIQK